MSWLGIYGHDELVEQFRQALRRGRLASTFLFVGPPGVGKRTFAVRLAQALLCPIRDEAQLSPCGACPACRQVQAETHPDLQIVVRPPENAFIPVESFLGDRDHRMREGLCHWISLKPLTGRRKIAVVDDADHLNQEGANCLLKTLEEPPPRATVILIGTSVQRQLPTIRSRCQVIRFSPLAEDLIARLLLETSVVEDEQQARSLACAAGGSLDWARQLADPPLWEFRPSFYRALGRSEMDRAALVQAVSDIVGPSGSNAPARRDRMRRIVRLAVDFYRQLMRSLSGVEVEGDAQIEAAVADARLGWAGDAETAAACADRCLDALAHVDANANQATLLDSWIDDLATLVQGGCLRPSSRRGQLAVER
jgi:DNA polymerase-3 subunit delta'